MPPRKKDTPVQEVEVQEVSVVLQEAEEAATVETVEEVAPTTEQVLLVISRPFFTVDVALASGSVRLHYIGQVLHLGTIDMDMTQLTETQIRNYAVVIFQKFYQSFSTN